MREEELPLTCHGIPDVFSSIYVLLASIDNANVSPAQWEGLVL